MLLSSSAVIVDIFGDNVFYKNVVYRDIVFYCQNFNYCTIEHCTLEQAPLWILYRYVFTWNSISVTIAIGLLYVGSITGSHGAIVT